jgi:putative transposase
MWIFTVMDIIKSYKVELDPNNQQRSQLIRHAGVNRFVYNWGLAQRINEYQTTGKSSSAVVQHKQIVLMKKTQEYSWLQEVSKCAPQEALRNLDRAYANFFRRVKKGEAPGFPKFKSRKKGIGSFTLLGAIKISSNNIKLPRIGKVKLKEKNRLPVGARVSSVTCSERAGHWFVSMCYKEELLISTAGAGTLGIDLGIKSLAVTSDGRVFENPRSLKKNLKKLARIQRKISRQFKGSNSRKKTKLKLSRLYYKISNIRKDALHKATSAIVKAKAKPETIVLESLNVSGMMKNRRLSQAISDVGFSEFRRQIEYKSSWNGINVLVASRFFPSSKICNVCGTKNENLKLSNRVWVCEACGTKLNRDLNAATNLANLATTTVSSTGSNACGQGQPWMKQESNPRLDKLLGLDNL